MLLTIYAKCPGETKIALKIDSEEAIRNIQALAEAKGLAVAVIRDAGESQLLCAGEGTFFTSFTKIVPICNHYV